MTLALILLAMGLLFSWAAMRGWRHPREERITLLEAVILKATCEEPLPLTRFDRWFQKFQIVMMSLFGPALVIVGVYGLLGEAGVL